MKVSLKDVGVLKSAEFEVGDFTIICGKNNTGKTYAVYALYGFLKNWAWETRVQLEAATINELIAKKTVSLPILPFVDKLPHALERACEVYSKKLRKVFSASENLFSKSIFKLSLDEFDVTNHIEDFSNKEYKDAGFAIGFDAIDKNLIIDLLSENWMNKFQPIFAEILHRALIQYCLDDMLPKKTFIASIERTGAALFRNELDFTRGKVLKLLGENKKTPSSTDILDMFSEYKSDYAWPVEDNVDTSRNLEEIAKTDSFITKEHPGILKQFAEIAGGGYTTTKQGVKFIPGSKGKKVALSLDESSSSVRSLVLLNYYLKHIAQPGDLLIIDEPELNLHPANQRAIARLLASLVNIGIKVMITTHSDYIIRELNALIMLKGENSKLKNIAKEEGYLESELLDAERFRVYVAGEGLVKLPENQRRVSCNTLNQVIVTQDDGIGIDSFDETLATMNRIEDRILWEDDDE